MDLNDIFSVVLKRILKFVGKINYMIDVWIFLCNLRIWGILYLVDKYIYKDDVYKYFEFVFEISKFDIVFMLIDNCFL